MGRIYGNITVNGKKIYTLFDSGSENNYITEDAVKRAKLEPIRLPKVFKVELGAGPEQ